MAAEGLPVRSSRRNALAEFFLSLWSGVRLLARNRVGLIGLIGLLFFLLLAFVGPYIVPLDTKVKVDQIYAPRSWEHPLGTDSQGKDVWSQIVHGGRELILVSVSAALLSTIIGASLGALSAVAGGRVDSALTFLTDIWLTVPQLPLLIVLAAFIRVNNPVTLVLIIGLLSWPALLRAVRSQVLAIKQSDYIEAARVLDLGTGHIVFREILPNMMSYITINFILAITAAMGFQATLVFLGVVPLSGNNWGVMIRFADTRGAIFSRDSFWYIMAPVLAIALFQLTLVALERGLAEVFNPRLRS
ncbi:MAG TPA: ABC transporter permease [Roseiflexaceae bacterium]|nr:ABC transporter permease [Roseiflexaceae bacterium]